jgi:hypothetical protein
MGIRGDVAGNDPPVLWGVEIADDSGPVGPYGVARARVRVSFYVADDGPSCDVHLEYRAGERWESPQQDVLTGDVLGVRPGWERKRMEWDSGREVEGVLRDCQLRIRAFDGLAWSETTYSVEFTLNNMVTLPGRINLDNTVNSVPQDSAVTIGIRLDGTKRATVAIYNVEGRAVVVLADNVVLPVGESLYRWDFTTSDGEPAGAGVYWIQYRDDAGGEMVQAVVVIR